MGQVTDVAALNGMYKEVYGDDIVNLISEDNKVQNLVKFVTRDKQNGNKYNQPVKVHRNQSATYLAAEGTDLTLIPANSMQLKNASLAGGQITMRSLVSYEATSRGMNSKASFKEVFGYVLEQLEVDHRFRQELTHLYGQSGFAVVSSVATNTITFQSAFWADGIWSGLEQAQVEIFSPNFATERTATTGGFATVSSINVAAKQVTFTVTASDLQTAGVTSGDVVLFRSAYTGAGGSSNESAGIYKILTNTGSLFGIDASQYQLWRASSDTAGGAALTQSKLNKVVATAVSRGLKGKIDLMLNPKVWGNLCDSQSALRRYVNDASGGKMGGFVNGADTISFYSLNGELNIHAHPYMWEGFAFGLHTPDWLRIGATEFTRNIPGTQSMFLQKDEQQAYETRTYSNSAIISVAPAKSFIETGIIAV